MTTTKYDMISNIEQGYNKNINSNNNNNTINNNINNKIISFRSLRLTFIDRNLILYDQ